MPEVRPNALGRALRGFLTDYLPRVRGASRHTVLSYRDAFKLLLRFLAARHRRPPAVLDLPDLAPKQVLAFLDDLETARGSSVSTRNSRLAAVQSFARYAAALYPEHLELCQGILALPSKRGPQRIVQYLEADEMRALLEAPDCSTSEGRRDRAMLMLMYNSGARVQEILDLRPGDLQLKRPFQVRLVGKGRKERICPLLPETAEALRALLERAKSGPAGDGELFRNRYGQPLTRFGVHYLLKKHARTASSTAPTLREKRVHPHLLRHTTATHLLQSGVDLVTISHWLGHASVETTNRYLEVNLEMKRAAIEKLGPVGALDSKQATWQADPGTLAWLEEL